MLSGKNVASFEDVQRTLANRSKVVIDVRRTEEFEAGRIPATHNVPCNEKLAHISELHIDLGRSGCSYSFSSTS